MRYPDFLIVGAARCGTTAVYRMLKQHPQVFLPAVKEPCFFAFADSSRTYHGGKFAFAVREPEKYFALFSRAGAGQVTGEASTPYLYLYKESISNMMRYLPEAAKTKIVILLRHPVERTYSNYIWRVRDGRETYSFEKALVMEEQRSREGYSFDYFYAGRSFYYDSVKAYLDAFPNVHIILYDELKNDWDGVMRRLCGFLRIDAGFSFTKAADVNDSYVPRSPRLSRWVTWEHPIKFRLMRMLPDGWISRFRELLRRLNTSPKSREAMTDDTRRRLLALFRQDVEQLSQLIGRDLSRWHE
ncbi:MAG: hypothetical protein RL213_1422 [Bacteroidota bacterium]|jgi:hypothetical protein